MYVSVLYIYVLHICAIYIYVLHICALYLCVLHIHLCYIHICATYTSVLNIHLCYIYIGAIYICAMYMCVLHIHLCYKHKCMRDCIGWYVILHKYRDASLSGFLVSYLLVPVYSPANVYDGNACTKFPWNKICLDA